MKRWVWGRRLAAFATAVLLGSPGASPGEEASEPERVVWDRSVIPLTLPVGKERLVHFQTPVKMTVQAHLDPLIRRRIIDGTLYLLAREAFDVGQMQVRELATGRVYLFDLKAREAGPASPVEVIASRPVQPTVGDAPPRGDAPVVAPSVIDLTRYASQQLYAPRRLLNDIDVRIPGVRRVALPGDRLLPGLYRGGAIEAQPIAAWRGGDLYVTAVRLRNLTDRVLVLDPRDLRGAWLTATFQHVDLYPADDEADVTCVYLVSSRPFQEAW